MFHTKLKADIQAEGQTINYVNSIPGSGKTWTFIHKVAVPHVQNAHNSVLVYAAPTEKLIDQVARDLVAAGIDERKIKIVSSRYGDLKVADKLMSALVGSKANKVKPVKNGTILLVTHECIARMPFTPVGKNRAVLIYDEARACLQDSYSLRMTAEVYDYLTKPQLLDGIRKRLIIPKYMHSIEGSDKNEIQIWGWNDHSIVPPTLDEITDLLPDNNMRQRQAQKIVDFVDNIRSSSVDVYVEVHEKEVKGRREYLVYNVFSPSRMFRGYGKVLILSAFFESSQMFHFLGHQPDTEYPDRLKDVTHKYVDQKRLKALGKRLRNVYLTYIFDRRGVTKTEMQGGLAVSALEGDRRKDLNRLWKAQYKGRAETYRTVYDAYTSSLAGPQYVTGKNTDKQFEVMADLVQDLEPSSVIRHMVTQSIDLYRAFLKRTDQKVQTLPVGINPRYKTSGTSDLRLWDTEGLEQLNTQTKRWKSPKKGPIITPLQMVSHGINAYQHLKGCAFLASMKYSPVEYTFLRRIVPEYDPTSDRTVDYAIQLLWRSNVRDSESDDPVLLIVTDKFIAKKVRERFLKVIPEKYHETALRIVKPQKINPKWENRDILLYTEDYDKERDRARVQKYTASAKGKFRQALVELYNKTPAGARYRTLTTRISQGRKAGKDVQSLIDERSGLQTFAQWCKTPEGAAAARELGNKRLSKSDVRKLFADPRLWPDDRRTRLGLLCAAQHLGLTATDCRSYPGDGLAKNWPKADKWKTGDATAYVAKVAQSQGIL